MKKFYNMKILFFQSLLVHTSHGIRLVPELYAIPLEDVEAELASPGSQEFVAAGRIPFMWAQSLYVISQLLKVRRKIHLSR